MESNETEQALRNEMKDDSPTVRETGSRIETESAAPAPSDHRAAPASTHNATTKPRSMSRTDVNFWLDTALLVNFMALIFVTVVVRFIFPPAINAEGWTLWGWTIDQWLDFQFGVIGLFTLGILLHLMLHWSWVCGVVSRRILNRGGKFKPMDQGAQTIFGVGLMIVLLNIVGLLVAAAALGIKNPL